MIGRLSQELKFGNSEGHFLDTRVGHVRTPSCSPGDRFISMSLTSLFSHVDVLFSRPKSPVIERLVLRKHRILLLGVLILNSSGLTSCTAFLPYHFRDHRLDFLMEIVKVGAFSFRTSIRLGKAQYISV
jgi:hypothetical protein